MPAAVFHWMGHGETTPVAVAFIGNTGDFTEEKNMNVSDWVPEQLIPLLTWLGKHDWLDITPIENGKSKLDHRLPDLPDSLSAYEWLLEQILDSSQAYLFKLFSDSKLLGNGPKLIRPAYEQCLALENVELNISFSDYKQPYPVLLVEFPQQYRNEVSERFHLPCPQLVLCHHDERSGYIMCYSGGINGVQVVDIMPPRPYFNSVEDAFNTPADTGSDIDQSKLLQRVAMNICLMLTNLGVRILGPSDPGKLAKLKKVVRGSKRRIAQGKAQMMSNMPTLITFAQEIEFFIRKNEESDNESVESEPTGRHNKPHWRRGHYRMQRIGSGRNQTRLTFIKPILINRRFFGGDESNTQTVYRGR